MNVEDEMTMAIQSPKSSVRSTTTVDVGNSSEIRDSFYFPGCRKDANCNCEICIASINATLDLMPQSSLTKLSSSRPTIQRSPISSVSSAEISTPTLESTPHIKSSAIQDFVGSRGFQEKAEINEKGLSFGTLFRRLIFVMSFVLGLEYGVSLIISRALSGSLSTQIVTNLGEKSMELEGLDQKFEFLKNGLEATITGNKISNCSSVDSLWKINQDRTLLNLQCVLYESLAEEVTIWGWPSQVSGLITAQYSSRSFTVLSGSITVWSTGVFSYTVKKMNSSWSIPKWSLFAVHFDPNTWILEYRKSFLLENSRLISLSAEFLKFRLAREFEKMKQEFWMPTSFCSYTKAKSSSLIPT